MFTVKRGKNVHKPLTQPPRMLVHRAKEIQEELHKLKPLHEELDQITLALTEIKDLKAYGVVIKDKFADRNTVWKASGTRRYELIFNDDEPVKSPAPTTTDSKTVEPAIVERLDSLLHTLEERLGSLEAQRRRVRRRVRMTPERLEQLAEAREAWFKKMGYGKYKSQQQQQRFPEPEQQQESA